MPRENLARMAGRGGESSNRCPACGAPIPAAAQRCDYCGARQRAPQAPAGLADARGRLTANRAWRRTWLYAGAVALVSLALATIGQLRTSPSPSGVTTVGKPSGPSQGSAQRASSPARDLSVLLATIARAGAGPTLLFATTRGNVFVLIEAGTSRERWRTSAAGEKVGRDDVHVVGDRILAVGPSRVTALRLEDGTVAWRTSLVADYASHPDGSLVLGQRLLVQLRDATTQAIEVGSGKTLWTANPTTPSGGLLAAGNFRVDRRFDEKQRRKPFTVFVSDVGTGQVVRELRPRCSTHSIIPANEPGVWDPALLSEDGNQLYLFYGFHRACVDCWDLRTGQRVWQSNRADDGARTWSMPRDKRFLMDGERIVYAGLRGIYSVRRRDGELTKILDAKESSLDPAFLQGPLLIVTATASWEGRDCRSAKTCALWAVDLDRRAVLWRHTLPSVAAHSPGRGARFAGRLSPQALALVQVSGAHDVVFDRLDLTSGVSTRQRSIKTDVSAHPLPSWPGWPGVAWRDGLFWLRDRGFLAVDPDTGEIRYRLD